MLSILGLLLTLFLRLRVNVSFPSPPLIIVLFVRNRELATKLSDSSVPKTGIWLVGISIVLISAPLEVFVSSLSKQIIPDSASLSEHDSTGTVELLHAAREIANTMVDPLCTVLFFKPVEKFSFLEGLIFLRPELKTFVLVVFLNSIIMGP